MSTVLVGATLPQFSGDRRRLLAAVRTAEDAGLDSLWVFDHLWPLSGGKERPVLEAFTTLAWLAGATERITIGTLVARSTLRHPALLAKMATTVAAIAPGRVTIAIGSGDEASRAENDAFGIPYFEADARIAQLEATVRVVHDHFLGAAGELDSVTVTSPWAQVDGLVPSPRLSERPRLWVGGRSDDVLELAGRYADGWNGWGGTPDRFAADAQQALAYADPRPLELSWGGLVTLTSHGDAAGRAAGNGSRDRIVGDPDTVAAALSGFVEAGARHLVATPAGVADTAAFYEALGRVRALLV